MKNRQNGFTLVEVLMASILACITLACIMQFFLTQLNQYRLISSSNKLNENLRIFSKFLEKDVHNSLRFYVFKNLDDALVFQENTMTVNVPTVGNCVLLVQERGMVSDGRGVIYHIGEEMSLYGQSCYPLYRTLVTFTSNNKVKENKTSLINLTVGFLYKPTNLNEEQKSISAGWTQFFETKVGNETIKGIFYTNSRKRMGSALHSSNSKIPYVLGCRRGLFIGTRLVQPGIQGISSQTICNFCFFSRNPSF